MHLYDTNVNRERPSAVQIDIPLIDLGHWVMSGGYINIDKDLPADPRVITLAEAYVDQLVLALEPLCVQPVDNEALRNVLRNAARNAALGMLVALWVYADTHIRATNTLPLPVAKLADELHVPVAVLRQLPPVWLQIEGQSETTLPDYIEKNRLDSREVRREQNRRRAKKFRDRRKLEGLESQTQQHVESNGNGERIRNANVTHTRAGGRARASHTQTQTQSNPISRVAGVSGNGRRPRPVRSASLRVWVQLVSAIDEVHNSASGLTWAHVATKLRDDTAYRIAEHIGFKLIAERSRYTQGDYKRRFREEYEQALDNGHSEPS